MESEKQKNVLDLIDRVEDWDKLHPEPLVCVTISTYNQEQYIAQTLDSVLMQETSFPFEVFIKEDFSTDGTRAIVMDYQKRHPDKIRLWLCKENLFSQGLNTGAKRFIKAKYIARCEGDDYWTDSTKLEQQVSYMEAHPDCVLSFHNVERVNEQTGTQRLFREHYEKQDYTLADMLKDWLVPTCSMVYRRDAYQRPPWMGKVTNGDYLQQLLLATKGKVHRVEGVMGVYRKHDGGMSQQFGRRSVLMLNLVYMFKMLDIDTGGNFRKEIEDAVDAWVMRSYEKELRPRIEQDFIADLDRLSSRLTPAQVVRMFWLKFRRKVRGRKKERIRSKTSERVANAPEFGFDE